MNHLVLLFNRRRYGVDIGQGTGLRKNLTWNTHSTLLTVSSAASPEYFAERVIDEALSTALSFFVDMVERDQPCFFSCRVSGAFARPLFDHIQQ